MKCRPLSVTAIQKAERSIALDFDGVIHGYSRGWHTKDIYDPPMVGAHNALKALSAAYGVFILSARPAAEILRWCRKQFPDLRFTLIGPKVSYWDRRGVIGVTNRKLPALAYVDDRAIRFTNWADVQNYFR
jgi:hypothetical protein